MLVDVAERNALPLGEAFRRIDAEDVRASLEQCRDALGVVARIDARANDIAFVAVNELVLVVLVVRVVLAEDHVTQALVLVDERQHVELLVPDDVVGHRERRRVRIGIDELVKRRHEVASLFVEAHAREAIVAARDDADEFAGRRAVFRDSHRGMARLFEQFEDFAERRLWRDVRIARDEAGLVVLDARDHGSLFLDGLGAIDEGDAALFRERDGHGVVRNGLHDGGNHRDVHGNLRLFALLELHEWRLQRDVRRNALVRGIARDEEILAKRMRWFRIVVCQCKPLSLDGGREKNYFY